MNASMQAHLMVTLEDCERDYYDATLAVAVAVDVDVDVVAAARMIAVLTFAWLLGTERCYWEHEQEHLLCIPLGTNAGRLLCLRYYCSHHHNRQLYKNVARVLAPFVGPERHVLPECVRI